MFRRIANRRARRTERRALQASYDDFMFGADRRQQDERREADRRKAQQTEAN